MHDGAANDVHDYSQEKIEYDSIAEYLYVSEWIKEYLEFLDLTDLNPQ
jgi:hypothetical protein